jgi:hypothetical protein
MKVSDIREKWPNIKSAKKDTSIGDCYCILGAACRVKNGYEQGIVYNSFIDIETNGAYFPVPKLAASILGISEDEAREIISLNDNEEFEEAWSLLQEKLEHDN